MRIVEREKTRNSEEPMRKGEARVSIRLIRVLIDDDISSSNWRRNVTGKIAPARVDLEGYEERRRERQIERDPQGG